MGEIVLDYTPTRKQRLFHEATEYEVLYGGAAGGGKSHAICWDAFMRCMRYPKTHAYLFRRTYPELEMTLISKMQEIVPAALGRYVSAMHEMRFINGSIAHFCYMSDEGASMLRYQGAEIQWLYFDELTHFTEAMYNFVKTRVRAANKLGVQPCIKCASNPGGPGHSWVKKRFVDATDVGRKTAYAIADGDRGEKIKRSIRYIPATVRDNPHISKEYEIELRMKPEKLRKALLDGNWDAFEGQAFPEFINDPEHYKDGLYTHVIEPFDIPLHWTRVVSFDHGYTRPFSFGVWAIDEEGRAYRYKELYGCKPNEANAGIMKTPGEIGGMLADLMQEEFREGLHVSGIADPAIWDQSRGVSVEEQIRSVFSGIAFRKGDNTRMDGKMQLHERFKFGEDGKPMLYVFTNCVDFIRTIPSLAYDARKVEDIDTAGEDHIYDETRYFLMSRPIAPRKYVPRQKRVRHPLDD